MNIGTDEKTLVMQFFDRIERDSELIRKMESNGGILPFRSIANRDSDMARGDCSFLSNMNEIYEYEYELFVSLFEEWNKYRAVGNYTIPAGKYYVQKL